MSGALGYLRGLFGANQPMATRVGLLNTGELVLVSAADQAQVLSADTTRVICKVLTGSKPNIDLPADIPGQYRPR